MTIEQMKESLKTIELLEKDLMRDLTKEEKETVIKQGWEELLFNKLNFTEDDFSELKAIRSIISAFYTQDEDIFAEAVRNAPASVYFVLKEIINEIEGQELCEDGIAPIEEKDPKEEYTQFMQDLYNHLPKGEMPWFNKLTEDMHKKLFDVYRTYRGETQNVEDAAFCGIMTDAVKDEVIKAMVKDLKEGKVIKMTYAEYLEVTDYLCEHEKKVFIHNDNGSVKLIKF